MKAALSESQYSDMKVSELKALAKANNITGYSGMSKEELVEALK